MPIHDPRHPVYHDLKGEKAEKKIMSIFLRWLKNQDPAHRRYFCQHGCYVGYKRSLSFLCQGCNNA